MTNTWFTSDTHFGHARIIELCNRPFKDVNHMNEIMIERWNNVVKPNDVVYHMGDVALGKIDESLPLVGRLNGHKFLVPGNHDRIFSGESEKKRERFFPEYMKVFQGILPESYSKWIDGPYIVAMSHFPYQGDSQENDRHVDKRPVDNGLPLIHGHIHEKRRIDGRMFNVGVDVNDFRPVHIDTIREWIDSL
jgi:calcineurin-like phosphoesterase family protein